MLALTAHMLLEKTAPLAVNDLFMSTPVKQERAQFSAGLDQHMKQWR